MSGDGNGWVICAHGHRHWGLYGAAGILLTDGERVMLQHRAAWTHEGGTWAVPGGARDSHEDAIAAALREAVEETTIDLAHVAPFAEWVDEHGGWSYTTVIARAPSHVHVAPANAESVEMRWWHFSDVVDLPLHAGFAAAWPHLRELLAG